MMINNLINQKIIEIAEKIGEKFKPEKIILFGSYAWGNPGPDSDVDLFIVKETENTRDMARDIDGFVFPRPFPMDILVYTSTELEKQINEKRNFFLEDIVRNGVVLYSGQVSHEFNFVDTKPSFTLIP